MLTLLICDRSIDRTYWDPLTVQISSDTLTAATVYLEKIRDSQLEEGKTSERHVMGRNAYVTSDILSWIIQTGVQPDHTVT